MFSTVLNRGYKPTHRNHPCTLWLSQSRENAEWLYELIEQLNRECQLRFHHNRDHSSYLLVRDGLSKYFRELPDVPLTPFAQAMPIEYQNKDDVVKAYRDYYHGAKHSFATWGTQKPHWWTL